MQSPQKYVPPAKRAQMNNKFDILNEEEDESEVKVEQKYEDAFPSIVTTTTKPNKQWEGKRKFSELAVQAELRSKEQKFREEIQKSVEKHVYNNYLPKFDNVGRFIEPEDVNEQLDEEIDNNVKFEDDEWTTVKNRKDRKVKSIEQRANRPPTPEEKPSSQEEVPDDSYWE